MSRIKHCAWCGEPQKEVPCETCGANEEEIHQRSLERDDEVGLRGHIANAKAAKAERNPCALCPWRADNNMSYDRDTMELVEQGMEPNCHEQVSQKRNEDVGWTGILDKKPTRNTRCIGYRNFNLGVEGFVKPINKTPEKKEERQ